MNILSLYRFIIRKIVLSGHNGNEYLVTCLCHLSYKLGRVYSNSVITLLL